MENVTSDLKPPGGQTMNGELAAVTNDIVKECDALDKNLTSTQDEETEKYNMVKVEITVPDTADDNSDQVMTGLQFDEQVVEGELNAFKCETCERVFKNSGAFHTHLKSHNQNVGSKSILQVTFDKKLKCQTCGRVFKNSGAFHTHLKSHRQNIRTGEWRDETRACVRKHGHMKRKEINHHNDDEETASYYVGKGRKRAMDLDQVVNEGELAPIQCPMCDVITINKSAFDAHIKSHGEKYPDKKGYDFQLEKFPELRDNNIINNNEIKKEIDLQTSKVGVPLEMRGMRKHKKFVCDICYREFESNGGLILHQQTHQRETSRIKCTLCSSVFLDKGALELHMKSHEIDKEEIKRLKQRADWLHECPACQQRFRLRRYLLKHMKRYHPEEEVPSDSKIKANVKKSISSPQAVNPNTCKLCYKTFNDRKGLLRHLNRHTRDKYKCSSCDRRFKSQNTLRKHKKTCQSDISDVNTAAEEAEKESYKCTLCSKIFKIKSCFDKHMKNHEEGTSGKFECKLCGKWFDHDIYLQRHKIVHSQHKPYKCNVCGKAFKYNVSYCRHMMSHPGEGEKSYECEICNKPFAKPYLLKSHLIVHKKERPFKCTTCQKGFYTKTSFRTHVVSHMEKPFRCDLCSTGFKQQASLDRHKLMHVERCHKCFVCGKVFKKNAHLLKHMKTHSSETEVNSDITKTHPAIEINANSKVCRVCNKVLASTKSLNGHMRIHALQKYKCDFCDKAFNKIYVLKSHLKIIHKQILVNCKKCLEGDVIRLNISKRMLFKCPVCGLVFIHHKELAAHIRIHTGQKPYECSICGETFNGRYYLQEHLKTRHSVGQQKPHACPICGKRFRTWCERQSHVVVHSDEKPFKCPHCEQCFRRKCNVQVHIERKHRQKKKE